jgi:hypothetical protein
VFKSVKLRYRENLPLALRGVSFDVLPQEKIGIVGRSGSGISNIWEPMFISVTCLYALYNQIFNNVAQNYCNNIYCNHKYLYLAHLVHHSIIKLTVFSEQENRRWAWLYSV